MTSKDTDSALKAYFSERHPLPPGVKAQVDGQLKEAAAKASSMSVFTPSRWIWGLVVYDLFISVAILFILWLFFGQGIIVFLSAAYASLSLIAATAIAAASQSRWVIPMHNNSSQAICDGGLG